MSGLIGKLWVEIGADTAKLKKGLNDAKDGLEGAKQKFMSSAVKMAASIATVTGTAVALYKSIKDTVDVTMDYAAEVRDLQRASGMTAEETSKIIQVFDDMDVSSETLTRALRKMSQEGITFSVEKMAEMSDEYLKLEEGAERNKFLLDNFGRAGLEMGKALEIGSDAIKQMADEMDGSLILTQDSVDAAREYEIAMDNMNDTVMGLKVSIGNQLIPVLTKAAQAFDDMMNYIPDNINGLEDLNEQVKSGKISYEQYKAGLDKVLDSLHVAIDEEGDLTAVRRGAEDAVNALKDSTFYYSEEAYNAAMVTQKWDDHEKRLADQFKYKTTPAIDEQTLAIDRLKESTEKYRTLLSGALGNEIKDFEQTTRNLKDELLKTNEEIEKFAGKKDLTDDQKAELEELKTKYGELQGEIKETADEHEIATKRILLDMMQQQMGLDGLSQKEQDVLMKVAEDWGLIDESTLQAWETMRNYTGAIDTAGLSADELAEKLAKIEKNIEVNVWLQVHGLDGIQAITQMGSGGSTGGGFEAKALGGAVRGGQPIQWGEYGRPEMLITPSGGGQVVNAQQIVEAMRSSGMDIGNKGVTIQQQTIYTNTRADLIQYSIERARGYAL